MESMRRIHSISLFVLLGSACSSGNSGPSEGQGGQGTSGASTQAGTTGVNAGAGSGGLSGTGGSPSQGGTAMGTSGTSGGQGATAGRSGSAGQATGGSSAGAGAGTAGSAGSAGSGGGAGGGTGGGATQSTGCGNPPMLKNGTITIPFNNASRKYILRLPDAYDNSHPYRLVFAFAESGSSATSVASRNYFTLATMDGKNTIFAAPDAADGAGTWSKGDVDLTDAILTQLEGDLCVDKTRIFATGFSFGGAMSLALACTRADVFRGVAFFSGADLTGSCTATLTKPIAYYASQASQDSTGTPMPTSGRVKQAEFAAVNGCTPEPAATTFPAAGQAHTCTNYKGCSAGHPTEYCVFDGPHGWEPKDPGQAMSWDAAEAWKFITQF